MPATPRVGSEFAGYRIESVLGQGGMAQVYVATHARLGRRVALKLLTADLGGDDRYRERFKLESQLAASIDHPNIIPVYEAGEFDGVLYIAMRYVAGSDLKVLLQRERPLDAQRTTTMLAQVAGALDAAHQHGLTHRDVKPANVLIAERAGPDGSDHVYLTDFGLSKHTQSVTHLTMTGQFVGTIDYTAPEQIEGKPIDGATDQYSLACTMYECLTGELPFLRDSEVSTMFAHLLDQPPAVSAKRPDLPAAIDAVVATALAKRREERYPSCVQMITAARTALGLGHVSIAAPPVAEANPSEPRASAGEAQPLAPPGGPSQPAGPPSQKPRLPQWRLGQRR